MDFIKNKYTRWYYEIIEKAKIRICEDVTEKHHILPKSLGGSDTPENLVALTCKEHFICHWLLTKMTVSKEKVKMVFALRMMMNKSKKSNRILTSAQYTIARKANKGIKVPDEINLKKTNKSKLGQKDSYETKMKKSLAANLHGKRRSWYNDSLRDYLIYPWQVTPDLNKGRIFNRYNPRGINGI